MWSMDPVWISAYSILAISLLIYSISDSHCQAGKRLWTVGIYHCELFYLWKQTTTAFVTLGKELKEINNEIIKMEYADSHTASAL